jgi:gliding motility-associated-like protein
MKKYFFTIVTPILKKKLLLFSIPLFSFLIGINCTAQIVGQYTGIDYATNYTNPVEGPTCSSIAAINASIGDADFTSGAAEVPLGWQFSGTWNSGLTYYDGPGNEILLVSLHTYTEAWKVALKLSNSTTTDFQPYTLTIKTTNATGNLTICSGFINRTYTYDRAVQELDFANYSIPDYVGVIGIIFEPYADGVGTGNPDPHGVLILEGTSLVANPVTTNQTICQGDSTLFHGTHYNATGIYTDSLINSNGYLSISTLNLTVNPIDQTTQTHEICQGDSLLFNGKYYNSTGVYTDSLIKYTGCDSISTLNLTVNPIAQTTQTHEICQGDSLLFNGKYYKSNGIYTDSLISYTGCDSILMLNLTVNPINQTTQTHEICQGDSLLFNEKYYNSNGIYTDSLISTNGCESLLTLILKINESCNCSAYIPNAFTPNIDNNNDQFSPIFNCIVTEYSFLIFNHWGELVFKTHHKGSSWGGQFKGEICPRGIYIYFLAYKYKGRLQKKYGKINLIR